MKVTVKPTGSVCFDAIARSIEATDKHLVRISDGNGLPAADNAVQGSRTLCEADLALVRAQLRAAAQSSSHLTQDLAEAQEELLAETAQDIETAVRKQLGSHANLPKRAACAAAIETQLWFGLALGEPPRSLRQLEILQQHEQHVVAPCFESVQSPTASADTTLSDLQEAFAVSVEFDWEQAASEAGLDGSAEALSSTPAAAAAELTAAELTAVEPAVAEPAPAEPVALPMAPPPLCVEGSKSFDSTESVATSPLERFDSSSSGNSEGDSRAESICSDFHNDTLSEFGESHEAAEASGERGEREETRPTEGHESEREIAPPRAVTPPVGIEKESEGRAAYESPRDSVASEGGGGGASDRRCSRRAPRPPKQWEAQVEAPLLKWEKEQQLPRGKRRAAKRHAASAKRMEVEAPGADTYETDSSEDLATQLGLSPKLLEPECFMLMADCAPAKRQRSVRSQ